MSGTQAKGPSNRVVILGALSAIAMATARIGVRRWLGTAFGGVKGRSQLPGFVDQYLNGTIRIDPMVTHTMGLEDINHAFELMHEGKSIRSVIVF